MMLTEAEAKTKWCPLSRVGEPWRWASGSNEAVPAAVNRGSDALMMPTETPNVLCIGSACMAWRRVVVSTTQTDRNGDHVEAALGYCGAFGRPPGAPQ